MDDLAAKKTLVSAPKSAGDASKEAGQQSFGLLWLLFKALRSLSANRKEE